jgi:hypothetical protein
VTVSRLRDIINKHNQDYGATSGAATSLKVVVKGSISLTISGANSAHVEVSIKAVLSAMLGVPANQIQVTVTQAATGGRRLNDKASEAGSASLLDQNHTNLEEDGTITITMSNFEDEEASGQVPATTNQISASPRRLLGWDIQYTMAVAPQLAQTAHAGLINMNTNPTALGTQLGQKLYQQGVAVTGPIGVTVAPPETQLVWVPVSTTWPNSMQDVQGAVAASAVIGGIIGVCTVMILCGCVGVFVYNKVKPDNNMNEKFVDEVNPELTEDQLRECEEISNASSEGIFRV